MGDHLQIDAVLHSGARVNWALPYAQLRQTNVVATHELVRFCARQNIPLHFVSTVSVADGERGMLDPSLVRNGYVLSKWAAEAHVRQAQACGLAATIYRPGMISGHSRTGAGKAEFFPDRYFRGCVEVGCAAAGDAVCDLTPVDYVASVIVKLLQNSSTGGAYNIYNPRSPTYTALAAFVGMPAVSMTQFLAQLGPHNALAPLLPLLGANGLPAAAKWGDTALQEALASFYEP